MRITVAWLAVASAVALSGCMANAANPGSLDDSDAAGGPVFKSETIEGELTWTTWGMSTNWVVDGRESFEVPAGTRETILDISWSSSPFEEANIWVRHENCSPDYEECPGYDAKTIDGKVTLVIPEPPAGTHLIQFSVMPASTSSSYVIEAQHEIWPDA